MREVLRLLTAQQASQVLLWVALAFGLWMVLDAVARRLRVPNGELAAALLSWLVARLFIWAVPFALQVLTFWSRHQR